MNWAKAYAFARGLPLLGVHHMEGHLFGTALEHEDAHPPFIGLLVSGGHTLLLEARAWGRYRLLGQTRDDAAGEAFDKVARRLGLPYPGGPEIQRAAERSAAAGGAAGRFRLPRPMLSRRDRPGDPAYYDMSFSGLKTAVARIAEQLEAEGRPRRRRRRSRGGLSGGRRRRSRREDATRGGTDGLPAGRAGRGSGAELPSS